MKVAKKTLEQSCHFHKYQMLLINFESDSLKQIENLIGLFILWKVLYVIIETKSQKEFSSN